MARPSRRPIRVVPRCRCPALGRPSRPGPHRMNRRIRIFRPASSECFFETHPPPPPRYSVKEPCLRPRAFSRAESVRAGEPGQVESGPCPTRTSGNGASSGRSCPARKSDGKTAAGRCGRESSVRRTRRSREDAVPSSAASWERSFQSVFPRARRAAPRPSRPPRRRASPGSPWGSGRARDDASSTVIRAPAISARSWPATPLAGHGWPQRGPPCFTRGRGLSIMNRRPPGRPGNRAPGQSPRCATALSR